jgi:hypothetical protein
MCRLCDEGYPQDHADELRGSRRDFLKASTAIGAGAAGLGLFAPRPAGAHDDDDRRDPPEDHGRRGRRYIIRGGAVMSMDPTVGDFPQADVLVEGKKIVEVGPNLHARGAGEIDARGRIVMPGFVDTHHHQFETALRSFLADGLLFNDGQPHGAINYFQYILGTFAPVYRPKDVYISELRPRSRAAPTPSGASPSASSRARAPTCRARLRVRGIRKARPTSGSATSPPATSS